MHNQVAILIMALRFFSRLPTGSSPHATPDLDRVATILPVASLVIGAVPALVLLGASFAGLPTLFGAGLAVGASVLVTGGMAEDALADAADGLFGGSTIERRLEIMKDSRHGTYGVAALCLFLLLRVAALSSMTAIASVPAAAIWIAITVMARSTSLWLTVALPPARASGASASAGRPSRKACLAGIGFAATIGLALTIWTFGLLSIAAALLMLAMSMAWADFCKRLVGGQTGDLIGALQALLEIAGLTVFLLGV
jgi:adenosylcobinamide-GDP ribazoletransferase